MKRIFLLALSACALAGSALPVIAQTQVEDRYGDIYHEGKLRIDDASGRFYRSHQEDQNEARNDANDQAYLNTEAALQRQIDVNTQIAINQEARDSAAAELEASNERVAELYRNGQAFSQLHDPAQVVAEPKGPDYAAALDALLAAHSKAKVAKP
jgi:hypothetical protein